MIDQLNSETAFYLMSLTVLTVLLLPFINVCNQVVNIYMKYKVCVCMYVIILFVYDLSIQS